MIRELFLENLSLWNCVWQSTLLAVVGLAGSFLLGRRPARGFQILFLAMMAAVLVPVMSVLVKHFDLGVLPAEPIARSLEARDLSPISHGMSAVPSGLETQVRTREEAVDNALAEGGSGDITVPWRTILALGWMIASLVLLGRLLVGVWNGVRLLRRSQSPAGEHLQQAADLARAKLGITECLLIRASQEIRSPMIWCWSRPPVLLVPRESDKNVDWVGVICHELAHRSRRDHISGLTAEVIVCLLSWNPLVWWSKRRMVRLGEQACDDWVVAGGHPVENYARSLLNFKPQRQGAFVPAVVNSRHGVAGRVRRLLRDSCANPRTGLLWASTASIMATCFAVGIALAQTRPAAPASAAATGQDKPTESLHKAAADGDIEQVKLLISKGADVNEKTKDGSTPLHHAAANGRRKVVQLLLEKGANVDATNAAGQTPLHRAATFAMKYVPALLLDHGANVNAKDKAGNTPLHEAASRWHVDKRLLELLLAKGADINAKNNEGGTPLHYVAPRKRPQYHTVVAANFLLANGADVNVKDKNGCTPLHVAAKNGRRDVIELLLAKGAAINEKTNDGLTAIHGAAMVGDKDVVKLLIDKGANVNTRQRAGWTPLHYAAGAGYNDIVELLISKGADINAKNTRGETPAQLAMVRDPPGTVRLLMTKGAEPSTIQLAAYVGGLAKVKGGIEKGIGINAQDGHGLTPLHAAAAVGQREVVEFLVANGADVNADSGAEGLGTPLHYAAHGGSKEVTELLLLKGAIVGARNNKGETPLHLAAQKGYTDLSRLLIASKADVNLRAQNGSTPLHFAATSGYKDTAALLIENAAKMEMRNEYGLTPLHAAAAAGQREVVNLLVDKGADVSSEEVLYYAVRYGDKELLETLIKRGADVNLKDSYSDALSLYAVWNRHPDVLGLLLAHGANPNTKDDTDWSLLHYAARNADMIRMLLDKGANPNVIENESGQAPLHRSAEFGNRIGVELLIARGADVNLKDWDGHTPLSLAKEGGHKETVDLLLKHGARE